MAPLLVIIMFSHLKYLNIWPNKFCEFSLRSFHIKILLNIMLDFSELNWSLIISYTECYIQFCNHLSTHNTHSKANREVLLHVKRERVRVTSDLGARIRYTSRLRTLCGFATRRDGSAYKQAHRYQPMTRHQSIKHIRKQNWTYTA